MRHRRFIITLLAVVTVISIVALLVFSRMQSSSSYSMSNAITLKSVSMVSHDDGWAVGLISGKPNNVLFHYKNGQWVIVKPIGEGNSDIPGNHLTLTGVSMVSVSEGWAIGEVSQSLSFAGVILHYSGGQWHVVDGNVADVKLSSLSMLSSSQGWMLGTSYSTQQTKLFHYDGAQWTSVELPKMVAAKYLQTMSVVSANNLWLAGSGNTVFHYDGQSWTDKSAPSIVTFDPNVSASYSLLSISMISADEGWAVGNISNSSRGAILHYQKGLWTLESDTTTPSLGDVTMMSRTEGWAVGAGGAALHYTGSGWMAVTLPTQYPIAQIDMLSRNEGWAVGQQGAILHYQDGTWKSDNNVVFQ